MIAKNSPTTIVPAANIPDRRFKNPPGLFILREREGCSSSIISGSSKNSFSGSDIIYFQISYPGGRWIVYLLLLNKGNKTNLVLQSQNLWERGYRLKYNSITLRKRLPKLLCLLSGLLGEWNILKIDQIMKVVPKNNWSRGWVRISFLSPPFQRKIHPDNLYFNPNPGRIFPCPAPSSCCWPVPWSSSSCLASKCGLSVRPAHERNRLRMRQKTDLIKFIPF